MEKALSALSSLIPSDGEMLPMLKLIGVIALTALVLGIIARLLLGTHSGMNQAVCSAIGILFVYALTIVIYTFNPADLAKHLAPLPFVSFEGETLRIFSFTGTAFTVVSRELLSMIILAFIANILDHFMPEGETAVSWFILRILCIVIAFGVHILISKALDASVSSFMTEYAPAILLCVLLFLLFLGLLKGLVSLAIATVNPVLGALAAFFFGNVIGIQLSKAIITSALLSAAAYALEHYGFAVVSIATAALVSYIPLIIVLLVLWYFVDRVF